MLLSLTTTEACGVYAALRRRAERSRNIEEMNQRRDDQTYLDTPADRAALNAAMTNHIALCAYQS